MFFNKYREVFFMRENSNEQNLVLISGKQEPEKKVFSANMTSPIRKKLLEFSKEKAKNKFKIIDLFKN